MPVIRVFRRRMKLIRPAVVYPTVRQQSSQIHPGTIRIVFRRLPIIRPKRARGTIQRVNIVRVRIALNK